MNNSKKGKLFNKAVTYLETNGFEHAFEQQDFSAYCSSDINNCGYICLNDCLDIIYVSAKDDDRANSSSGKIAITKSEEHLLEPILNVLMFALKLAEHKVLL